MTTHRSIDPNDYQSIPRPLSAMAKQFPDGFAIQPHSHMRDQLVHAVSGTMRVHTGREAWIVPPDRAAYLPGGVVHSIDIRGDVDMRTVYLVGGAAPDLPMQPAVLEVSDLLRALILALIGEPILYDEAGRGGAIARLILSEIVGARALPLVVPMPRDTRLRHVCAALLADPGERRGLDGWAETAGASSRTLARLFESEVGLTFTAWRQRARFHNAMEALARGEQVALVASRNGYRSTSAFAAAFRKTMGVSPSSGRSAGSRERLPGNRIITASHPPPSGTC